VKKHEAIAKSLQDQATKMQNEKDDFEKDADEF
jgi:hypothetical protein